MFKFIKLLKESAKREEEAQEEDRMRKENEMIEELISSIITEKIYLKGNINFSLYLSNSKERIKYREIIQKTLIAFIPKIPEYLAMNPNSII